MVLEIVKQFGTIDVVHSNAGITSTADGPNLPLEVWNRELSVNLTGMLLVNRAAANLMVSHKHGGSIINTGSMSGHIVNAPMEGADPLVAYATSKAGVVHLTKALALHYIKYGIRINSVSYGYTLSGLHDECDDALMEFLAQTVPMKRFACLDEITGIVAYLASELSTYCVGSDFIVDGGYMIT